MFNRRNWTYYSKTFVCSQESTWPALSQVLNARDRSACCVGWKRGNFAQQASLGWITSSFFWHILQDRLTWTAWLKISFALATSARMTLDCRLLGSNAKLLTLSMCRWLCPVAGNGDIVGRSGVAKNGDSHRKRRLVDYSRLKRRVPEFSDCTVAAKTRRLSPVWTARRLQLPVWTGLYTVNVWLSECDEPHDYGKRYT